MDPGRGGGDQGASWRWKKLASFRHKGVGAKHSLVVPVPHGSSDSLSIPKEGGLHPRNPIPEPEPVELEAPRIPRCADQGALPDPGHVQASNEISYTTLPGCQLTKSQDEKIVEIARTKKAEIPLHVASMDKTNVNLKDSFLYVPLQLVLNNFKEETTIQLEAPDNVIYSVGARKHSGDLMVIESGWNAFVASLRIQEKDLLIFRSKGKARMEVVILDPSGHEKTSSYSRMENHSSSTQETSTDSLHIIDAPPPEVFNLSSSDEDDMVREGTRKSCRGQRVTRSCAKTQKIASTSSPSTKSGYGARKPHDRAPVKLRGGSEPLSSNLEGSYILQSGVILSLQANTKVEEKVQAIQPKVPIFVKVMTRSSVDGTGCKICEMVFGREYGECLPKKTRKLVLELEGKERQWQATLDTRSDVCCFLQRRISKGWKEFSGQNGLEMGDICLFKLEDTKSSGSLKMTVYLIRKSQIEP